MFQNTNSREMPQLQESGGVESGVLSPMRRDKSGEESGLLVRCAWNAAEKVGTLLSLSGVRVNRRPAVVHSLSGRGSARSSL